MTPEDVVFSFDVLKEHNPQQAYYYQHVEKAEKTGDHEVTFTFDEKGNRELPHIVGQLLILPKHYWEGTDAMGNKRDVARSTLEPPLGSGPYRVKSVVPARTVVYERVPDYWGKDLPVNIGSNNFDEIRYEYFRDETVELEAFKADQIDWRQESTARVSATGYDFPAVKDKRVVLDKYEEPYRTAGLMLGFVFNLDRDPFKDPKVRQAFNLAFPYEDINKSLFYGQYVRLGSYFDGIPLAAEGLPKGRELELLEEVRAEVPPEVFTEVYKNPDNGTPTKARNNLRAALKLLRRGRLEARGQPADRARRQADDRRVPDERAALREDRAPLPAGAGQDRHPASRSAGRHVAIREPRAQPRLRHHVQRLGPVDVAGQRADRVLGFRVRPTAKGRGTTRDRQPGGRRADPEDPDRARPRRADRRDQGARPRPPLERLSCTRMDAQGGSDRALGPLWPSPIRCRNMRSASRRSGGGTRRVRPRRRGPRSEWLARRSDTSRGALSRLGAARCTVRHDETVGVGGRTDRAPWSLGVRRSQIRSGLPPVRLPRPERRPRAGACNFQPPNWYLQPERRRPSTP